ncbi:unnamed protein product, partial [Chrysoparadoxa australica]
GIDSGDASINEGKLLIRLGSSETQLRAADALKQALGNDYIVALNLAPTTPDWLRSLGAQPMNLGLDLRGGVHFLLEVDMATVIEETYDRYARDLPRYLRDNEIRYSRAFRDGEQVRIRFPNQSAFEAAQDALNSEFSELDVRVPEDESTTLAVTLSEDESERIRDFALEQNLTTLRNRVNEIGVAEPLVQRQGQDRIVVELPGVQDTAQAKRLLGKTATLEYRLVARGEDPRAAEQSGVAPPGTELYQRRRGE